MSKVWKTIQKVTYAISGFSMFAVIILIFINSLCRYIFKYSIPWCEEMTRFMFIATIFFTLNIMVANKAALRVDILDNLLHGTAKFILERIIALLTLAALRSSHSVVSLWCRRAACLSAPACGSPCTMSTHCCLWDIFWH